MADAVINSAFIIYSKEQRLQRSDAALLFLRFGE